MASAVGTYKRLCEATWSGSRLERLVRLRDLDPDDGDAMSALNRASERASSPSGMKLIQSGLVQLFREKGYVRPEILFESPEVVTIETSSELLSLRITATHEYFRNKWTVRIYYTGPSRAQQVAGLLVEDGQDLLRKGRSSIPRAKALDEAFHKWFTERGLPQAYALRYGIPTFAREEAFEKI